MRSDNNQLDVFRDDPRQQAEAWRIAAETSKQQFPNDEQRYAYYLRGAEEQERRLCAK